MKRRQLLQNASAAFISTLGLGIASNWQSTQAQTGSLRITSLGHMCFQFAGNGKTILTNPFDPRGCTQGYSAPSVSGVDLVLVSSRLLDEGFIPETTSVNLLDEPGAYEVGGLSIQGVGMPHDREGGRRFGINTAWLWTQAGINIVHLGGAAAPIDLEDKILIGRPDLLLVPVGGGPKAYTPAEAVATVKSLQPKVVIPTQYRTNAASTSCELEAIDKFLDLMAGTPIERIGNILTLQSGSLPTSGMRIKVLS
ncbi:MAG: MBL fold metallo-hydrolase [Leptolyngbya sp. SIO3F4]|nr:MBL fold metallo-hydrolase [Leptolyngbya sp. SIO3F4]